MLQPPQLRTSSSGSTHWPLQDSSGRAQVVAHMPWAQVSSGPQVMPQAPQLRRSTLVFTQAPLQSTSPGVVQPCTHWPLLQVPLGPQERPQPPQLFTSVRGSTQPLAQLS